MDLSKMIGWTSALVSTALVTLTLSATAHAGPILIVNGESGTSEPGTTSQITNNLSDLHTAAGNMVTIADNLPVSLSDYAQVWDIRFSNTFALNTAALSGYTSFLQAGGGLFLMGENDGFMNRNNSIFDLIDGLGGGSVGFTSCSSNQTVHAPFTGPNDVSNVNYAAPGCFDSTGNGQWITSTSDEEAGSGLAFAKGSLANALEGALTTILDVNFMQNRFDLPESQNLTKNLIGFVGDQVGGDEPPVQPVPEPGSLALLGLGLSGLVAVRRRKATAAA